ncbi:MAG TPA: oligosaccharide flippase family protein [Solirubrobacteraceae bacterium]|nr:oligosaccharide flippase family protein [Solirubrobacteraceae bacterium]
MSGYLKRLLSALGAYQIADAVSKVLAVLLLPVYTRYVSPAGYGVVETLATFVIFVSIVVRFGMIESFLRFYFSDEDAERRSALARRAVVFLLITSTIAAVALIIPAGPLVRLVTTTHRVWDFRVAVLGVWAFTNLELAYALLRVEERLRAYAVASVSNVALTVIASVILVVGFGLGALGLLIANYGATLVVLLGLWWTMRDRLRIRRTVSEPLGALLHFGLPTVPAEASVYALSVLDRQYVVHARGASAVGFYSLALKLAGAVAFIVRAFQYAWPPLAYSVRDGAEAGRLYGLVTTYYVLISGWVVAGLALESRWILRLLAAPRFFESYRAVPWVSLGWAMYGLWVVLLVIAGRAKVTRRNFPAALAGLAVNVALLILLVPRYGIAGAGVALCGAYVAMLGVMYLLVRSAFPVTFEWRRLAHIVAVMSLFTVLGDLLLPTHGDLGLLLRALVLLAIPAVLALTGFAHRQELSAVRGLVARMRAYRVARRGAV